MSWYSVNLLFYKLDATLCLRIFLWNVSLENAWCFKLTKMSWREDQKKLYTCLIVHHCVSFSHLINTEHKWTLLTISLWLEADKNVDIKITIICQSVGKLFVLGNRFCYRLDLQAARIARVLWNSAFCKRVNVILHSTWVFRYASWLDQFVKAKLINKVLYIT